MRQLTQVVKRSGAIVPFSRDRIMNAIYRAAVAVGGRNRDKASQIADQVVQRLEETCPAGHIPQIEGIQDIVEKTLIENGHAKVAKEYILYRAERKRRRQKDKRFSSRPSDNIPWSKIWHVLDWAVDHNLHTIAALNNRIARGEFTQVVQESEAAYEEDLDTVADAIAERQRELKMVMISGPSSSGKTTTTIKLEQRLQRMGLKFTALNVDNYFFNLDVHPKDEFGDYDFETPQALDLALINEHLEQLSDGKEVAIPFYNFKTGVRQLNHTPMQLEDKAILLIDSLHGLYPAMSEGISSEKKFKLYLEPLLQIKSADGHYVRWTDIRMIRRMLRDSVQRSYNPQQTLEHWHYVRTSELRNIIPYSNAADYIISSAMPYELALYRARMLDLFATWEQAYCGNQLREDAYRRAARIHALLKRVEPMADDTAVPADSVLREFIGGSCLKY